MDPFSEIEAEHDRRSLRTLDRVIKRTVQPPWKRRLKISVAVLFLVVMLVVTVTAVRRSTNGAASRCPQSGEVTDHGWLSRRVWWFTVTNPERRCSFSVYTDLDGYLGCGYGDSYPRCAGRGGGSGDSW
jgi:hypothetical protein